MSSTEPRLYGLTLSQITAIQEVLRRHGKVDRAILYGSRAKGNFRSGSDIDLTLRGEGLSFSDLAHIANDLDDLLLPFNIDLSILQSIENPDLVAHIHRVGVDFYTKDGPGAN